MLNTIRIRQFRSYREETIIKIGGSSFVGVLGPNGAGKSSLAAAIEFVTSNAPAPQGWCIGSTSFVEVTLTDGNIFCRTADSWFFNGETLSPDQYTARWGHLPVIGSEALVSHLSSLEPSRIAAMVSNIQLKPSVENDGSVKGSARANARSCTRMDIMDISDGSESEEDSVCDDVEQAKAANRDAQSARKQALLGVRKLQHLVNTRERYSEIKQRLQTAIENQRSARIAENEQNISTCETRLAQIQEDLLLLQDTYERASSRATASMQEFARARRAKLELETEIRDTTAELAKVQSQQNVLDGRLTKLDSTNAELCEHLKDTQSKIDMLSQESQRLSRRADELQALSSEDAAPVSSEAREAIRLSITATSCLKGAEIQYAGLLKNFRAAESSSEELQKKLSDCMKRQEELTAVCERQTIELDRNHVNLSAAIAARDVAMEKSKEARRKASQSRLNSRQAQAAQRRSELVNWLKQCHIGVRDTLGALVGARDPQMYVAVQRALGSHARSVVVDNVKTASQCIADLRSSNRGQLTFIALSDVDPTTATRQRLPPDAEYVGDIALCSRDIRPALAMAVRSAIIAPTMQRALEIRRMGIAGNIIDFNGSLLSDNGLMSTPLGAQGAAEEAALNLEQAQANYQRLQDQVQELELCHNGLNFTRNKSKDRLRIVQEEINDFLMRARSAESTVKHLRKESEAAAEQVTNMRNQAASARQRVKSVGVGDVELVERSDVAEISRQYKRTQDELEYVAIDIDVAESVAQELRAKISSNKDENEKLKEYACCLRSKIQELQANIKQAEASAITEMRRVETAQAESAQASASVEEAETAYRSLSGKADSLRIELERHLERRQVVSTEVLPRSDIEQLTEELKQVTIASGAESQLHAAQDRLEHAKREAETARNRVSSIQRKIDNNMRSQLRSFKPRIESFQRHLSDIWIKIYGSGATATLNPIDPAMPWQGLSLAVHLPDKQYENATQMSGGERAAACIALLLAAQRAQGSTLVVLDEVDAALDYSTTLAVTEIFRAEKTVQFIVLSHKRIIHVSASRLVGVYNAGNGSQALTRKLPGTTNIPTRRKRWSMNLWVAGSMY